MTKTVRKFGRWSALVCGPALAFGGLLAMGCEPPVPASPSYEADVRPIFAAHCTRCHGAGPDGGAINTATQPTGPDGGPLASDMDPTSGYDLGHYADSPAGPGAYFCVTHIGARVSAKIHGLQGTVPMPPPPAPLLSDWEVKVVDAWIANPICSNSPSPDPSICPPDGGQ